MENRKSKIENRKKIKRAGVVGGREYISIDASHFPRVDVDTGNRPEGCGSESQLEE